MFPFSGSRLDSHRQQVADIQPTIIKSLGEIEKLPWIGVAINLGTIAILPL